MILSYKNRLKGSIGEEQVHGLMQRSLDQDWEVAGGDAVSAGSWRFLKSTLR